MEQSNNNVTMKYSVDIVITEDEIKEDDVVINLATGCICIATNVTERTIDGLQANGSVMQCGSIKHFKRVNFVWPKERDLLWNMYHAHLSKFGNKTEDSTIR